MPLRNLILRNWQSTGLMAYCLVPVSWIYWLIITTRKKCYDWKLLTSYRAPVPLIVVGNISVGGSGKTPLVMHLVEQLKERGMKPAVISRGYGGAGPFPLIVDADMAPTVCGDEPALIVRRTQVPMVVGPNRAEDIALLVDRFDIDVVISDDGLQHYALARDIEISLIDETVISDNNFLLPAGPLREPRSRLDCVDFAVHHVNYQGETHAAAEPQKIQMQLVPLAPRRVDMNERDQTFPRQGIVHAVAGIGQPDRFFRTCEALGMEIVRHAFADHHHFKAEDLQFGDSQPVLMTEKDAVKCRQFATEKHWYLPVDAKLSDGFTEQILVRLNALN